MNTTIGTVSRLLFASLTLMLSLLTFACEQQAATTTPQPPVTEEPSRGEYDYYDGPYITYHGSQARILRVSPGNRKGVAEQKAMSIEALRNKTIMVHPDGLDQQQQRLKPFGVKLFDYEAEQQWTFEQPEKLFAISDIECSFLNTVSMLQAGRVIDEDYNWIYGKNHLVVNGDVFSRGLDMVALLWLLYKLDNESQQAGGKMHLTIGNHEAMNLKGDVRYVMQRYLDFCNDMKLDYASLFDEHTELGRWLRTKYTIVRIGRTLFVHAGISKELMALGLHTEQINDIVRRDLGKQTSELGEHARVIFGSNGPHWYRGMVLVGESRNPIFAEEIKPILAHYDVDRVVVGHCKGDDIYKLRDKLVVVIDVNHTRNRAEGRSRALLLRNTGNSDELFRVYDDGTQEPVPEGTPGE